MKQSKLQVWWIPQMPMKAFNVSVDSVVEGVKIMNVLADYDLFQFENRVKPDYANAGGLNVYDEEQGEWEDWTIDFDVTVDGTGYSEYFDEPERFVEFLEENGLTEEQVYKAMSLEL